MECEICNFNNPKGTTSAVIIKDGQILLLKRKEEPFLGKWDLPGGYMNAGEMPEASVKREIKEELGVDSDAEFINWFPGEASWKGKSFAILCHAFFVELKGNIALNKEENEEFQWQPIDKLNADEIAFNSNQEIIRYLQKNYVNYSELMSLINHLDPSAKINEVNLYKSLLNGYFSKKIVDGKLVGVGWIFSRRTLLRKQAVLEDIVVDPSQRGKGFGEEITVDLIRWAKENGVEMIELTTNPARVAANSLYQKLGFKIHPTNHYLYKV